jgi:hypothetical protein
MSFDPESDDASIRFSLMELGDPPKREEHVQAPLARVVSTNGHEADHVARLTRPRNSKIVDLDADPFVPDGWSVEVHKIGGILDFDPAKIGLYLSEKQKVCAQAFEGYQLRKELKAQLAMNANLLDWLLHKENRHFIPEEWKEKAVFFWGTIYRDSDGRLIVRYLYWDDGVWRWGCSWLVRQWVARPPVAVSAS